MDRVIVEKLLNDNYQKVLHALNENNRVILQAINENNQITLQILNSYYSSCQNDPQHFHDQDSSQDQIHQCDSQDLKKSTLINQHKDDLSKDSVSEISQEKHHEEDDTGGELPYHLKILHQPDSNLGLLTCGIIPPDFFYEP